MANKQEKPAKRGRPPKPAAEKRSEVVYIKVTPAEKEFLWAGLDEPTAWAREVLLRAKRRLRVR